MKTVLSAVLMTSAIALAVPAFAALKGGQSAPDFKAEASLAGKEFTFSLKDALQKGPVVVYFYPSAYTGGCNVEAHTFAEDKDKFDAAGATIIGVSQDSIKRLNEFSADPDYCAGKFPVVSDADGAISKSYELKTIDIPPGRKDTHGAEIDHAATERTTFIVGRDGKVLATLSSAEDGIKPGDHVEKSLAIIQKLAQK